MIILKAIGYSIISGIIGTIVFFCIGLYFEIDNRDTTTKLKYNSIKKEYYEETVLVEEDISGETTSYFASAGLILGLIVGIFLALDDSPNKKADNQPKININQDTTSTK